MRLNLFALRIGSALVIRSKSNLNYTEHTVSNMRDIGGLAANGGTIKYGKLYRGEALVGTNTVRPIKLWLRMLSILDSVLHTVILHLFQ